MEIILRCSEAIEGKCLAHMFREVVEKLWVLHHDNALAHASLVV